MSVDLPAPFSPQIAWISPRRTDRLTFSSALTPGKVLVMERISRMWSSMDSVVLAVVRAGGNLCGGQHGPAGGAERADRTPGGRGGAGRAPAGPRGGAGPPGARGGGGAGWG